MIFVFTHTCGFTVLDNTILPQSATTVYVVPSGENDTELPVAVVSDSRNWYSPLEYSIAGNPNFVARYIAVVVADDKLFV